MMKKTLAAFVALGALATAAAPAMAQPHGDRGGYDHPGDRGPGPGGPGGRGGPGFDRGGDVRGHVDAVLAKVDRALSSNRLSRSERNSLSYRGNKLRNMERQYERGGFSDWEVAALNREANDLDARVDRAVRW